VGEKHYVIRGQAARGKMRYHFELMSEIRMRRRVGLAAFMQESNSFSPRLAGMDDFQIRYGEEQTEFFRDTNSETAGFLDGCSHHGWESIPLLSATAISGGPLAADCFERIVTQLRDLARNTRMDALLLALHGAMSTEEHPSGDAEIARRLREALGPDLPIVVSHDFHANVTPGLLRNVDGVAGYRTYPHIDQRDTGRRASEILARIFAGAKTVNWRVPVPMLISPQFSSTFEQPLLGVMDAMAGAFPDDEGSATLFCVQPWLDFTPVGGSVVLTDWSELRAPQERLREIAGMLWARRRDFPARWTAPQELTARIAAQTEWPVLVSEGHDAPTGGASGDHTGLLHLLLPRRDHLRCCLYLVDPAFVQKARAIGVGGTIDAEIGASIDPRFSKPVRLQGMVARVSDGEFTAKGPAFHGRRFSMGPAAVIATGQVRIVAASHPVMMIDPELFRSQGIEPSEQDVVGVKSPTLFRPAYESISRTILYLDMAGPCQGRIEAVPFRSVNRPIFPLDEFDWDPPMPERIVPTDSKL
jgi:microcystin degradation protein MlrC